MSMLSERWEADEGRWLREAAEVGVRNSVGGGSCMWIRGAAGCEGM